MSVAWRATDYGAVAHAVPRTGTTNRVEGPALCGVLPASVWRYTRRTGLPVVLGRCRRCRDILPHAAESGEPRP